MRWKKKNGPANTRLKHKSSEIWSVFRDTSWQAYLCNTWRIHRLPGDNRKTMWFMCHRRRDRNSARMRKKKRMAPKSITSPSILVTFVRAYFQWNFRWSGFVKMFPHPRVSSLLTMNISIYLDGTTLDNRLSSSQARASADGSWLFPFCFRARREARRYCIIDCI